MFTGDLAQYVLLGLTDVHYQHMFACLQAVFKANEIGVWFLYSNQAALPGTETENDDGEEYGWYPGNNSSDAGGPCGTQNYGSADHSDNGTAFRTADYIFAQNCFHIVKVMRLRLASTSRIRTVT